MGGRGRGPGQGAQGTKGAKHNHHNGQQLLGDKVKTNRHHKIRSKGDYTASVEVKDGKVVGMHVKYAKKGDVPVKQYKTNKKMAAGPSAAVQYASLILAQTYVGTVYIGYAYVNEYGEERSTGFRTT